MPVEMDVEKGVWIKNRIEMRNSFDTDEIE